MGGVPCPHLHAHCVLFNAVADPAEGGRWKAAQVGDVKWDAGYYEAVLHARLAANLTALGFGVRRKGRAWELAGLDDALLAKFSERTALIERVAAERGLAGAAKAGLGRTTRERKAAHLTPDRLRAAWVSRLTDAERHQLVALGADRPARPTADQAAGWALAHCFAGEAVRPAKAVYEAALRHGVGGVTLAGVKAAAAAAGLLVKGEEATTRAMLGLEADIVRFARDGRGACRPVAPGRAPAARLTAGQRAGVRHVWRSPDRVTLVRGAAGVGKTTALRDAVAGIAAGLPVQALAQKTDAVDELAAAVSPGVRTLAAFLLSDRLQEGVRGGVVVLDEASQVGTVEFAPLLRALDRVDARLVAVGDVRQHGAVTSGSPFRLLQRRAGLPVAEITEIVRQQAGDYRAVCRLLSEHRVAEAFDRMDASGWVRPTAELAADYLAAVRAGKTVAVVDPTHKSGEAVTARLRAQLKGDGRPAADDRPFARLVPLFLTEVERSDPHSLPEGAVLRFHRRAGRHKAGERVAADPAALRRPGCFQTYRPATLDLAAGDRLRITAPGRDKSGRHKLATGACYTVTAFTPAGEPVLDNGWVLPRGFAHWTHGLVTTSFAAQGRTADVVLVVGDAAALPAAGAEQFYVSASRGREACRVYADDREALRRAVQRSQAKSLAHDLVGRPPDPRPKRHALFLQRLTTLARAAAEQVRHLVTHREYGYRR